MNELTERKASREQCIKIIAEIVVNMNIVARINFNSKLKNSTSEIGYYSYTHRCSSFKETIQLILFDFMS